MCRSRNSRGDETSAENRRWLGKETIKELPDAEEAPPLARNRQ
jgi:hypothetical protein